ncbi:MAG: metal ABC transporter substrate-binding protein [Patescibacteria group bacterium]|nr:metal ABC transporter substrate-binding protein [Patescibacteria group bacterium]
MKKQIIIVGGLIAICAVAIVVLMYIASQKKSDSIVMNVEQKEEKLVVTASIFPLYDIVRNVAGDRADVHLLLPPGASPHFFEFTPQQINKLKGTDTAFVIGYGIDNWAEDVLESIGADVVTVDSGIALRTKEESHDTATEVEHGGHHDDEHGDESAHEHSHGDSMTNPHYWLDMNNAARIAQNVADVLAQNDPNNSDAYQQNAQEFITQLALVDQDLQDRVATLSHKDMITLHKAWPYFAAHFGLHIAGTFMPEAGTEPSPQYLANLGHAAEEMGAGVIFTEPQLSTQSIETFAKDNDLKIAVIDPLGGVPGRDTYIDLMVYNVNTIVNMLEKK